MMSSRSAESSSSFGRGLAGLELEQGMAACDLIMTMSKEEKAEYAEVLITLFSTKQNFKI